MSSTAPPFYFDSSQIHSVSIENLERTFATCKDGLNEEKLEVMKDSLRKVQAMVLENVEIPSTLMMAVVIGVMSTKDKELMKMLHLLYSFLDWETLGINEGEDASGSGALLVCSPLQEGMDSRNEFFAAATIRSLCFIPDRRVLENLTGPLVEALNRTEPHVLCSAVIAIHSVYSRFPTLFDDPVHDMKTLLLRDGLAPTVVQRALMMLADCSHAASLEVLTDPVYAPTWARDEDVVQMARLHFVRSLWRRPETTQAHRAILMRSLGEVASRPDLSVLMLFEVSQIIFDLCQEPKWLQRATYALLKVLTTRGANDLIRVTALSRIEALIKSGLAVDLSVEKFKGLFTAGVSRPVKTRLFRLVFAVMDQSSAPDALRLVQREVASVMADDQSDPDDNERYCAGLVDMVADAPDAMASPFAVDLLLNFITLPRMKAIAVRAASMLRRHTAQLPKTDPRAADLVDRLFLAMPSIVVPRVLRVVAFIIVSCAPSPASAMARLVALLDQDKEQVVHQGSETVIDPSTGQYVVRALEDTGSNSIAAMLEEKKNAFVAISLSLCLAKLFLASLDEITASDSPTDLRRAVAGARAKLVALIIKFIKRCDGSVDLARLLHVALNAVLEPTEAHRKVLLEAPEENLARYLAHVAGPADPARRPVPASAPVAFRLLQDTAVVIPPDVQEENRDLDLKKLLTVRQLTGQSERIYTEVFVSVRGYSVVLEVVLLNRSSETVQDVTLELTPTSGLRCADRIISATLGPHKATIIKRTLRATATEAGIVFGAISYTSRKPVVNTTTCIQLDVSAFLTPSDVDQASFKAMWQSFEWENKINLSIPCRTAAEAIELVARETNTKVLDTPVQEADGAIGCANLYAVSVFNEQALINVSCQYNRELGKMEGVARVRTKVQGLAVSLGEKVGRVAT